MPMDAWWESVDVWQVSAWLQQAGQRILLPMFARQSGIDRQRKADCSIVTEADVQCQAWLRERLRACAEQWFPSSDVGFLGEEMESAEQLRCARAGGVYWCIDPLDGTGNFAGNIPLFAISLALMQDGRPCMAWIHDPIRQETFTAVRGRGACLNGNRLAGTRLATTLEEATGFVDFKRLPADVRRDLAAPGVYRSQRNLGSCALEWAWLAASRGAFIVHGGQRLWDYAAGVLLCEEVGGVVSDFHGASPFSSSNLRSGIVAAADAGLHRELLRKCHRIDNSSH